MIVEIKRDCVKVFPTLMSSWNDNKSCWELKSKSLYESFLNKYFETMGYLAGTTSAIL